MDFNIILTTAVLLHTLQLPSMSKGQALQWQVNKSSEIIFGRSEMELICSGSACCTGSLRRWTAGPSSTVLMSNGAPSDSTKYEEILATNSFSLKFKSLELADFNLQYKCSIDFATSTQNVLLPTTDVFRYVPDVNNEIKIEKNLTGGNITLTANLTRVFPEPTCTATLEDSNITDRLVLTTYENTPVNFTIIEMNNIPYQCSNGRGNLFISCYVGSIQFTVIQEELCQSESKKSWISCIVGSVIGAVWSMLSGLIQVLIDYLTCCVLCCCLCCWLCCMLFTVIDALAWCYYLSRRYVFNGRVVYGIQLVIVAAISQPITIISAGIVLTQYEEQNNSCAIIVMILMIPVSPFIADGIYFLCKAFCGQKELTYNKFEDDITHFSLSKDHSMKFANIKEDKIWFKVWAKDDVLMTLFGNDADPFLNIIIGYGKRHRKFSAKASKPVSACEDVLGTDLKYRIFYLTCEKHCVTVVRVLNGKEETILNWTNTNCDDALNISDIRISNYMQDLIKEKEPKETTETTVTEADAAKTAITISKSGTPGEWIFFIRKGDCLHEDDDDSRWSKNLTLFLVLLLAVAWIVVPILFIIKLIMHRAKDTRNSKVSSAMVIKNRKDATEKWEEKSQPNDAMMEEKSQPNDAMIAADDEWRHKDVGKNNPNLPSVDLNNKTDAVPDNTKQTKKKAKSKKKKNGSSRNEIQQPQEDTGNNTVQTVTDQ